MATYAIGDIQGCFGALRRVVDLIHFDPDRDTLWFVGDLVNRGPDSLSVLRWIRTLHDSAATVLGNHDLHLLSVAEGITPARKQDTLQAVLAAPDRDELLIWLRHRPLLHEHNGFTMVHAGLLPAWDVTDAATLADEVAQALRAENYRDFLRHLATRESHVTRWTDSLSGFSRLVMIADVFTRIRMCRPDGQPDFAYKGPPAQSPPGLIPWFQVPDRKSTDTAIVCGHWSALGLQLQSHILALDTGCVWGGPLTAVRLEDRRVFQTPAEPKT